jgi:hypothetical protein
MKYKAWFKNNTTLRRAPWQFTAAGVLHLGVQEMVHLMLEDVRARRRLNEKVDRATHSTKIATKTLRQQQRQASGNKVPQKTPLGRIKVQQPKKQKRLSRTTKPPLS